MSQPRTLLLAEHSGFCHGVKKAVNKTIAAFEQSHDKPTVVLGQLIHNQQEIDRLKAMGIETVGLVDELPEGSTVVVRTHGAPPELFQQLEAAGHTVQDATCPDVTLVQRRALELANDGYTVVVVGKANHPEVVGILGHLRQCQGAHAIAVNTVADLHEALATLPKRKVGVVSQTTQLEEAFFDMVKHVAMVAKEMKVYNTICPATYYRQHAALELANKVDVMVVVGGKNSSNTSHLADICREVGKPTLHVETPDEALLSWPPLQTAQTIGITAGASTPDWVVEQVMDALRTLPPLACLPAEAVA
jgi:4-hydroxy-3-methylbut-2-enyl diphosphate reductase